MYLIYVLLAAHLPLKHILTHDMYFRMDGFCYTTSGEAIEDSLKSQVWKLFLAWEAETTTLRQNTSTDQKQNIDLDTFLRNKLEAALGDFPKEHHQHIKCIFNCLMNYERFHQGTALDSIPAFSDVGCDCDVPGRNIKVKAGMSKLVHALTQSLTSHQIKLKKEVVRISLEGDEVLVNCLDGDVFVADHVIVTMSLGVLKQNHHNLFIPALSEQKQIALGSLAYGKVNKIFLKWEKPFWNSGMGCIKFGWADDELEIVDSSEWYKRICSFDEVLNNRHVLVGWISGDEAECVEGLSETEIIDTCTDLLRKFLGNPSIPKPTNAVCSSWCRNQFTRGSYSNTDFKTSSRTFEDLAVPICDSASVPRIMFAGEATANMGYSTMNGARRSGLREAQNLLLLYSKKPCPSKL